MHLTIVITVLEADPYVLILCNTCYFLCSIFTLKLPYHNLPYYPEYGHIIYRRMRLYQDKGECTHIPNQIKEHTLKVNTHHIHTNIYKYKLAETSVVYYFVMSLFPLGVGYL